MVNIPNLARMLVEEIVEDWLFVDLHEWADGFGVDQDEMQQAALYASDCKIRLVPNTSLLSNVRGKDNG